jgi:dephospho-CoA kinase
MFGFRVDKTISVVVDEQQIVSRVRQRRENTEDLAGLPMSAPRANRLKTPRAPVRTPRPVRTP